jgi:hypothetical protein
VKKKRWKPSWRLGGSLSYHAEDSRLAAGYLACEHRFAPEGEPATGAPQFKGGLPVARIPMGTGRGTGRSRALSATLAPADHIARTQAATVLLAASSDRPRTIVPAPTGGVVACRPAMLEITTVWRSNARHGAWPIVGGAVRDWRHGRRQAVCRVGSLRDSGCMAAPVTAITWCPRWERGCCWRCAGPSRGCAGDDGWLVGSLGLEWAEAFKTAEALVDDPHPLVELAAAVWSRPKVETPAWGRRPCLGPSTGGPPLPGGAGHLGPPTHPRPDRGLPAAVDA